MRNGCRGRQLWRWRWHKSGSLKPGGGILHRYPRAKSLGNSPSPNTHPHLCYFLGEQQHRNVRNIELGWVQLTGKATQGQNESYGADLPHPFRAVVTEASRGTTTTPAPRQHGQHCNWQVGVYNSDWVTPVEGRVPQRDPWYQLLRFGLLRPHR